jgi:hypothetical protein
MQVTVIQPEHPDKRDERHQTQDSANPSQHRPRPFCHDCPYQMNQQSYPKVSRLRLANAGSRRG